MIAGVDASAGTRSRAATRSDTVPAMRRHLIFLLIAVACSKTKDEAKPVTPAPAGSGSVAENPPPKPAGGDYDGHVKTGTTLEDQKKWSDALIEFEAALVAKPDDARALTEVGFTAYLAGKLDRAKEASLAAVLAAKDDKLRGAALFNLGLAVEKTL